MSTERRDLLASLHPVTRVLRRIEEAAAAREGMSMWQYALLSVVADGSGRNQREMAEHLQYSPNRVVTDLHDLERRGYLTRRPGVDRRANTLDLTEAGDAVRRRIRAEIHDHEDELLGGLADDERECLVATLGRLAELARAAAGPASSRPRRGVTPPGRA
jgi:DNA-binding MarR family transcriptional regulator